MRRVLLGVLACAMLAPVAAAQLTLTSDQRAVLLEAAGSSQTSFPPGAFSPFVVDITLSVPSGGGSGTAHATQTSTVSAGAMSATGASSAESQAGPANCVLAQATSDFRLEFTVPTPVQYTMEGSVDGAQFRLAETIGGAVHLVLASPGDPTPYSFTGVLKPGRHYLLLAQSSQLANACDGAVFSLAGSYSLEASFTALPPCPGDLNFDRVVNDEDFVIFLAAYNILLCPAAPLPCDADLNQDGVVNDEDFVIFLAGYNVLLCP